MLYRFPRDYVAQFRNQSASRASLVENWGQILHLWPSVKFKGGVGEMFEWFYGLGLGPNLSYIFHGRLSGSLTLRCQKKHSDKTRRLSVIRQAALTVGILVALVMLVVAVVVVIAICLVVCTARPLPAGPAAKPVERVEEKQLLATLHEEGLIQRPIGRGAFSVSFEVMSELAGQNIAKPPPRLAKLEHKKKKKKALTEAEIRQKLERAEQRRKVLYWSEFCRTVDWFIDLLDIGIRDGWMASVPAWDREVNGSKL